MATDRFAQFRTMVAFNAYHAAPIKLWISEILFEMSANFLDRDHIRV